MKDLRLIFKCISPQNEIYEVYRDFNAVGTVLFAHNLSSDTYTVFQLENSQIIDSNDTPVNKEFVKDLLFNNQTFYGDLYYEKIFG